MTSLCSAPAVDVDAAAAVVVVVAILLPAVMRPSSVSMTCFCTSAQAMGSAIWNVSTSSGRGVGDVDSVYVGVARENSVERKDSESAPEEVEKVEEVEEVEEDFFLPSIRSSSDSWPLKRA